MPAPFNTQGASLFSPQLQPEWEQLLGGYKPPPTTYQAPTLNSLFGIKSPEELAAEEAAKAQAGAGAGDQTDLRFQFGGTPTLEQVMANLATMNKKGGGPGK